jgi:UDPglucose--hexose-1-phosphate uridylyltransferase
MPLRKKRITKPDGRDLWFYAFDEEEPLVVNRDGPAAIESAGLELRWNPILQEWNALAPQRQERTFLPPDDYCPLCPTREGGQPTEVPAARFELAVFENRFPSMERHPARPGRAESFEARAAAGASEVVVYTPVHSTTLAQLPLARIQQLIDVWTDRYEELASRREVEYVLIFENRGVEIGVTLTHPHGQIYAFPFVPPVPARELRSAATYRRRRGSCPHCDIVRAEIGSGDRIVAANDSCVAFVPYYARLPYEVHVVPRAHRSALPELTRRERRDLAGLLRAVVQTYDALWSRPMPFVMVMHQRPVNGRRYPGCHLHIEFLPPYRSADRLKYLAGCETGAGMYIVDARPEQTAAELRKMAPTR